MKKIIERLLLFFVGLPLILASVFFFPQGHYLLLNVELLAFTLLAVFEMRNMLSVRFAVFPLPVLLLTGVLIPLAAVLYVVCGLPYRLITFSIAIAAVLVLFFESIQGLTGRFERSLERILTGFAVVIYPGYLAMYLTIMTKWDNAGIVLSIFLLMVFGCDSLAWLFGVLLGKNNRGVIPASPNKSIAGFLGGYAGSFAAGFAGLAFFPAVFPGSPWKMALLAVMTATASIVGDIIESVMKRSAGIKDSGALIPGRGGVLDSIDSILLAAPVFYILGDFLYGL